MDTSHDYETVKHEIHAALDCLTHSGFLGGDDYGDEKSNWGVAKAVTECLPYHIALFNRLWLAMP